MHRLNFCSDALGGTLKGEAGDSAQALLESRSRPTRPDIAKGPDWRQRRPKYLFSGVIKCGACGGGMSLVSRVYYGCAARRDKGSCDNRATLRLDRLEEAVLGGLQDRLLTPELTDAFVREYTAEYNRLAAEADTHRADLMRELKTVSKQIDNIVEAVSSGRSNPASLDRLDELERRKSELDSGLGEQQPTMVRLHPNVGSLYADKVADLQNALNSDDTRAEAAVILRGLVDEIRLHPVDGKLQIKLIGELATLLMFANEDLPDAKTPGSNGMPGRTKWLVAGARTQRESLIVPINL